MPPACSRSGHLFICGEILLCRSLRLCPAQPRTADAAAAHSAGERADRRGGRARAAISTQQVCTSVGGRWAAAACKVGTAPLCAAAVGSWSPRRMWSLEGGVDMLIVGLLQGCGGYPFFDPCAPPAGPSRTPQRRVTGGVCCSWSGCCLDDVRYVSEIVMPCFTEAEAPSDAWRLLKSSQRCCTSPHGGALIRR